jgi:hypothetical protein
MRFLAARRLRFQLHIEMTALFLHGMTRHGVFFVSGFAQTGAAVEFPVMPRTNDIFPVKLSLSQRAAGVITNARDRAEFSVLPGNREFGIFRTDLRDRCFPEVLGGTQIVP